MATELIKDFGGKVIARIETDAQGNKIVKDFYGKVLGRYDRTHKHDQGFLRARTGKGGCCGDADP